MGNFIFDQMFSVEVREGNILEIVLRDDKVVGLRVRGVEIEDLDEPRAMTAGEHASQMDRFWSASDRIAAAEAGQSAARVRSERPSAQGNETHDRVPVVIRSERCLMPERDEYTNPPGWSAGWVARCLSEQSRTGSVRGEGALLILTGTKLVLEPRSHVHRNTMRLLRFGFG